MYMIPLRELAEETLALMYHISEDIIEQAAKLIVRIEALIKRCGGKLDRARELGIQTYLHGAFPRIVDELERFYDAMGEFKQVFEKKKGTEY